MPSPLLPYPDILIPLSASIFPNKLTPSVPNNIPRNLTFCSFASF